MSVYLIGRSSSHFTRIARVFAHELGVAFEFSPVLDLMSRQAGDFAGNPLLRLPILETPEGPWFGTLGICRELARRSPLEAAGVIWPEDLPQRMAANTQELVLQGMATEVSLVMGAAAGTSPNDAYRAKQQDSLQNALDWLEQHAPAVVASLPQTRRISFLEVSLFCFVTHLHFRALVEPSAYPELQRFAARFGLRPAAQATEYAFDKPA